MTIADVRQEPLDTAPVDLVGKSPEDDAVSRTVAAPDKSVPAWLRHYQMVVFGLDLAAGAIAGVAAHAARFGNAAPVTYLLISLVMPIAWTLTVALAGGHTTAFLGTGSEEYRNLARAGVWLVGATALLSYAFKLEVARGFVIVAIPVACGVSLVLRYGARKVLHAQRVRGACLRTVVLVGRAGAVLDLARQLRNGAHCGMRVVAACVPDPVRADALRAEGVDVAGDLDDAASVVRRFRADSVAVTSASETAAVYLRKLSWQLEGTEVELLVAPGLMEIAGPRLHVRPFVGLPLLQVQQPEFTGVRRVVKTLLDRIAAAVGLLLLMPLFAAIAVMIRLDSPGPVLFRQERIGMGGAVFTMFKFRTMVEDAESRISELSSVNEGAGVLFKVRNDPRITRVGAILRRYSLDELPQLANVLLGSMSLVGPRPPLASEVSRYDRDVHRRLLVQPGLTGLWQVSGRSDLDWEESVRLDLRYVENWSLPLDAMILWKTMLVVLRRRGAY